MDSRFKLKGTFSIYGKTYPIDMNLNWSAMYGCVDRRIHDFFLECHDDALSKDRELAEEKLKVETEARERAELARLKSKYPEKLTVL